MCDEMHLCKEHYTDPEDFDPGAHVAPPPEKSGHPVRYIFDDLYALVEGKSQDYADTANVFSNFEGAARLTGLTIPQVFHVLLGIKMERLRQIASGKEMNFESAEDTLMDLANYAALWLAWERFSNARLIKTETRVVVPEVGIMATLSDVLGDYPPGLDNLEGV